ncbi:MAG: tRNA pseudouridine(55) synthase TruB [Deltaproteobacteria bacterium]
MNGFFVIDKPSGITSHDVVSRVRRILGTRKVGHTGTLDPFATGVLPIAVNEATKSIQYLDERTKSYEALLLLGIATDTLDITGRVIQEADWHDIDLPQLEAVLANFTGSINQLPPMFSAIKQDGQPLYKLARQGVEVERKSRQIEIHSLELLSFEPPLLNLRVFCSRGTYIRSLADDIGKALGCGATLKELRRTASGMFNMDMAVSLETLASACHEATLDKLCISTYSALNHLTDIPISANGLRMVRHGRSPGREDVITAEFASSGEPQLVRLSYQGALAAIGQLVTLDENSPLILVKRVFA